jgi:hypothetical protein
MKQLYIPQFQRKLYCERCNVIGFQHRRVGCQISLNVWRMHTKAGHGCICARGLTTILIR